MLDRGWRQFMIQFVSSKIKFNRSERVDSKWIAVGVSVGLIVLIVGGVALLQSSSKKIARATPTPQASSASSSGKLEITDQTVGTGAEAVAGKSITVSYTGTLADGTVFDSTAKDGGKPFTFTLGAGQVIKGWDQGVVGMKVGGVRKLVIPPDLAYGSQGAGSTIPPNATLTFVVTLINVQ
jgi:FKBP-type peptidyl-prolyl cis-trans isomerase FkpA